MARILLIDDDPGGREMAAYNLRKAGHRVDEAADGRSGLDFFLSSRHDMVITDVRMPEMSGIEVAAAVHEADAEVPVLVVTAFGNIETAVEAMKAGAEDFLLKPFSRDQLLLTVDKALGHKKLEHENRELRRKLAGVERPLIYRSQAMKAVVDMADRVAASDASVLISGESGTGKELVARRIHSRSTRSDRPFVAINCAAIPADLMEAELFGHERGAFTGADRARPGRFRQADGGSLFLDEIAELPRPLQGKLLRVVQEGSVDTVGADHSVNVDVRVIAASNRDLNSEVEAGRFREDLYFRLNVIELTVPPLRERPDDISPLFEFFTDEFSAGRDLSVEPELLAALQSRAWPGNVRQLRNLCERMVVLCTGGTLHAADLPAEPGGGPAPSQVGDIDSWPALPAAGLSLLDLEKRVIERVLEMKKGNIAESARYLRIPRHILVYRIEKYGIERPGK